MPEDYRYRTGGYRFRATVPQEELVNVPWAAQDTDGSGRIHWATESDSPDPFLGGVYWGLSWSLSIVFGDVIGAILESLTLSNVEVWNNGRWDQVA